MDITNVVKGMTADMHEWGFEAADKDKKAHKSYFDRIADVRPLSDIKGLFYQTTSAIGAYKLRKRARGESIQFEDLSEGYPVYASIQSYDLGLAVPYEMQRFFPKVKDFIRKAMFETMPTAIRTTKELAVHDILNYGAYTSGHAETFNQDIAGFLTTGYTDYIYDGKPFLAASGNNHTKKNNSTYYNAIAGATLTNTNLKTAHNLLTSTNAYTENGTPIDQTQNKVLVVGTSNAITGDELINSTLIPDGTGSNIKNSLKGEYELISTPWLTSNSGAAWAVGVAKQDIIIFVDSEPSYEFWYDYSKKIWQASASIDIARCVKCFSSWVGCNFATLG